MKKNRKKYEASGVRVEKGQREGEEIREVAEPS